MKEEIYIYTTVCIIWLEVGLGDMAKKSYCELNIVLCPVHYIFTCFQPNAL